MRLSKLILALELLWLWAASTAPAEGQVTIWQSGVVFAQADPVGLPPWCTPGGVGARNGCFYLSLLDGVLHVVSTTGDVPYGIGPQGIQGPIGQTGPPGPMAIPVVVAFTLVASPTGGFTTTIPLPTPGYHLVQCFNQNGQANVQAVTLSPVSLPTKVIISYNAAISGVCLIL